MLSEWGVSGVEGSGFSRNPGYFAHTGRRGAEGNELIMEAENSHVRTNLCGQLLRWGIPALLATFAMAQTQWVAFKSLPEGLLEERLRLAHPNVGERYQRLRALFEKTGCTDLHEQKVSGSKEPNLICKVAASDEGARRIVVGAHYDSAGGDGVIDNWTGAILLPSLAEFMRAKPRRHVFHFVGFAAEERGLWGSKEYLRSLKASERKGIAAVVAMDSLGLSPTKCWPNSSNKELIVMGAQVAHAMGVGFAGVNVDAVGNSDSMVFHRAKIPVLSLHSLTQDTWKVINSRQDVWESLSWKDYYDTHRFVSALLVYLDEKLP